MVATLTLPEGRIVVVRRSRIAGTRDASLQLLNETLARLGVLRGRRFWITAWRPR